MHWNTVNEGEVESGDWRWTIQEDAPGEWSLTDNVADEVILAEDEVTGEHTAPFSSAEAARARAEEIHMDEVRGIFC